MTIEKILLFEIDGKQYGISLPLIISIHRAYALREERIGESEPLLIGPGGERMPLFDLTELFGSNEIQSNDSGKEVILVRLPDRSIGLKVGDVNRVVMAASDQIEPLPPVFRNPATGCFPNVLKHEDSLVILFDPQGMENVYADIRKLKKETISHTFEETDEADLEVIELTDVVESLNDDDDEIIELTDIIDNQFDSFDLPPEKEKVPTVDTDLIHRIDSQMIRFESMSERRERMSGEESAVMNEVIEWADKSSNEIMIEGLGGILDPTFDSAALENNITQLIDNELLEERIVDLFTRLTRNYVEDVLKRTIEETLDTQF